MKDLDQLLEFVRFTHEIRTVERAILLESNKRSENDMEHGYQLALVAWFLIEKDNLKLDKFKVVGMALLHDVVEVYAGDVPSYAPEYNLPSKAENEKKAAVKLKKQWPEFVSLHQMIDEYEARTTPEAQFVYALDKLIPVMNNYIYDGRTWKMANLDLDWLKASKVGKVDISAEINTYYKQLLKILEKQPELFGAKK
jgi:putative hydrolase of HD superfamily